MVHFQNTVTTVTGKRAIEVVCLEVHTEVTMSKVGNAVERSQLAMVEGRTVGKTAACLMVDHEEAERTPGTQNTEWMDFCE